MTSNAQAPGGNPSNVITVKDKPDKPATLEHVGGSQSDEWNVILIGQVAECLWLKNSSSELRDRQVGAAIAALISFKPADELESMLAAQLISCHNAAMECYRRAMIGEQSLAGRSENLSQANKLSRSFTTLLEALNRHRGKGQQKVTVEHIHVNKGGQAIVRNVTTAGGGRPAKSEEQPHAKGHAEPSTRALPMGDQQCSRCKARTRRGTPCQSPAMANGRCRMHGGASTGAPKGNKYAFRHGRYTADSIAFRREIAKIAREAGKQWNPPPNLHDWAQCGQSRSQVV